MVLYQRLQCKGLCPKCLSDALMQTNESPVSTLYYKIKFSASVFQIFYEYLKQMLSSVLQH